MISLTFDQLEQLITHAVVQMAEMASDARPGTLNLEVLKVMKRTDELLRTVPQINKVHPDTSERLQWTQRNITSALNVLLDEYEQLKKEQ